MRLIRDVFASFQRAEIKANAVLISWCCPCTELGDKAIAAEYIGKVPVCRGCAEAYRDCPELLPPSQPELVAFRAEISRGPMDERCFRGTRRTPQVLATTPKIFLAKALYFPWRMIQQAIADAKVCKYGCPTFDALRAYRWLHDDIHESYQDGVSFSWCCAWISDDAELVRREGLRDRHSRERMGGLNAIHKVWEDADRSFQLNGGITAAVERELSRRQRERDRLLRRAFHGIVRQKQLGFISESHYLKGGSHHRKQVA